MRVKAYTDIEQSRKLAEILPLESADMCWILVNYGDEAGSRHEPSLATYKTGSHFRDRIFPKDYTIPCWSLAALLNIIKKTTPYRMEHFGDKKVQLTCVLGDKPWELILSDFNNEVDACVDMIILLIEQKYLRYDKS